MNMKIMDIEELRDTLLKYDKSEPLIETENALVEVYRFLRGDRVYPYKKTGYRNSEIIQKTHMYLFNIIIDYLGYSYLYDANRRRDERIYNKYGIVHCKSPEQAERIITNFEKKLLSTCEKNVRHGVMCRSRADRRKDEKTLSKKLRNYEGKHIIIYNVY